MRARSVVGLRVEPDPSSALAVAVAIAALAIGACAAVSCAALRGGADWVPVALSGAWATRADRTLGQGGRLSESQLRDAAQATGRELDLSPADSLAWLRLAYVTQLQAHTYTPAVGRDLGRSYTTAPLNADLAAWRLRFAFENWDRLDPALRHAALDELGAELSMPDRRYQTPAIARTIASPTGRLAFAMAVGQAGDAAPPR